MHSSVLAWIEVTDLCSRNRPLPLHSQMAEKEHEKKKKSNLPVLTLSNSMGGNRFRGQEVDLLELIGGGALVAAAAEDPGEHGRGGGVCYSTLAAATGGETGERRRATATPPGRREKRAEM